MLYMRDAMRDNYRTKFRKKITAQGKWLWTGIAVLAIITVMAIVLPGVVEQEQNSCVKCAHFSFLGRALVSHTLDIHVSSQFFSG